MPGTTTTYLARALRGRRGITVITNSLPVLAELADQPGITLVSSGGVIRTESRSLTGPGAEATFRDLRADKAFIAGTGLSLDFGLSNTNIAEASVKQAMLRAARGRPVGRSHKNRHRVVGQGRAVGEHSPSDHRYGDQPA